MNWLIHRSLVFFISFALLLAFGFEITLISFAKGKTKSSLNQNKKTKATKLKSSKKKQKPKNRVYARKVNLNQVGILQKKELQSGVFYKKVQFGQEPHKILVHLIEVEIDSTPYEVKILKAKSSVDGLDFLKNIYDDYQFELTRIYSGELIAIANANFWSAFMNYPIGIFVSEGEVISLKKYKDWSSVFFDTENRPYIDNFELTGELILPDSKRLGLDNVNRRKNGDILVLYNKYYGEKIPKVHIKDIDKALQDAIASLQANLDFYDSTEVEIDTNEIRNQLIASKQEESIEFSTPKLIFKYLDKPVINRKVGVEFLGKDSGLVEIPSDGFVISLPLGYPINFSLKKGDICYLYFATDRYRYISFQNAVSGTPRLVRKGIAKHEAYQEGSRGFRFIGSQLPRTAIGTNMSKTRIFLFVVEASKTNRSLGANLTQLAIIAKKLGCFDAMNLDGGGSSIMLVNGLKVWGNEVSNGRKISGAIGVSIKNK